MSYKPSRFSEKGNFLLVGIGKKKNLKIFLNWQTVPELHLSHLLWHFLPLPLKLLVLSTQTECKTRQTSFFHFYISSVKTNKQKNYDYTIQLSIVIVSLENLKRRIELLIQKFPLTVRFKKPLEESFGL